jgi:hypothetical protein
MIWGPRQQQVLVAVVFDPQQGFFVSFNDKWGGYAFPMRKPRSNEEKDVTVLGALREAVQRPLPRAVARPLEFLEYRRNSGRTGKDTWYFYQAYEIEPGEPLPGGGGFATRHGFLSYEQLRSAEFAVTWSTRALARELMEHQQVGVAIISRAGPTGREYLMIYSTSYKGYFFPASRRKTEAAPVAEVEEAVRRETGYTGPLTMGQPRRTEDRHFSPRFGRERRFVFHAVPVTPTAVNLTSANNALAASLRRSGICWRWVSEAELADPGANGLSPTVTAIVPLLQG